jgi:hypothetical protein
MTTPEITEEAITATHDLLAEGYGAIYGEFIVGKEEADLLLRQFKQAESTLNALAQHWRDTR